LPNAFLWIGLGETWQNLERDKRIQEKKGDVSCTRLQELGGLHIGAKWKPYQCGEERTHKPFSLFVTDTHQMKFRSTAKSTH